jgi:hypothetical protein
MLKLLMEHDNQISAGVSTLPISASRVFLHWVFCTDGFDITVWGFQRVFSLNLFPGSFFLPPQEGREGKFPLI